jgi:hypothetical protein
MTGYSWLLLRDRGLIADSTVVRRLLYFTIHDQTLKGFLDPFTFVVIVNLGLLDIYEYNRIAKPSSPWPSAHMKAVARAPALWWFVQDAVSVRSTRMPFDGTSV